MINSRPTIPQEKTAAAENNAGVHFADFIRRLDPQCHDLVPVAGRMILAAMRQGHICLALDNVAADYAALLPTAGHLSSAPPTADQWRRILLTSRVVGTPGEFKPLILDASNRLYLYRYWDYEQRLAGLLKDRARAVAPEIDHHRLRHCLDQVFPSSGQNGIDWQKIASAVSALKKLSIISGGPGTGKTFTALRIMTLMLMLFPDRHLRIGLAAPTGKAAVRLQESIHAGLQKMTIPPGIKSRIPCSATTLHRLLGYRHNSPFFRHNKENLLHLDMLIVDEASMMDLALTCKLVEAMPPDGRLIFLGDKDQLASVEAGSVLGDICSTTEKNTFSPLLTKTLRQLTILPEDFQEIHAKQLLSDNIILLEKNRRFGEQGGIGRLARAIQGGNIHLVDRCFEENSGDVRFIDRNLAADRQSVLAELCRPYRHYLDNLSTDALFADFNRFRMLCPQRYDSFGIVRINKAIETLLEIPAGPEGSEWYHGRPILITQNDYGINLFNGDIGITCWSENKPPMVCFTGVDGSLRKVSPSRLPPHETAWAMTIHKSQGTEFDHVVVILPEEISPLVTREMLYTACTRAKKKLTIWGNRKILAEALCLRTQRQTGLRDYFRE